MFPLPGVWQQKQDLAGFSRILLSKSPQAAGNNTTGQCRSGFAAFLPGFWMLVMVAKGHLSALSSPSRVPRTPVPGQNPRDPTAAMAEMQPRKRASPLLAGELTFLVTLEKEKK